jgi:hypothetical protein
MNKEYETLPKINRNDLLKAGKHTWVYLPLFITDDMDLNHREIMPMLNRSQQTYLTFYLMDKSMHTGHNCGFLQLMYDGYGEYVFETLFAETIKTWGATKISGIIEMAKSLYEKYKDKVEKAKTEKELSCLRQEITDFDMLDHEYIMVNSEEAEKIKEYIENNTTEFAVIDETNSQVSHVDLSIKEMDDRMKMFEEFKIIQKYINDNISKYTINYENNTLVISAYDIFGENNTLFDRVTLTEEINGKKIKIDVERVK